MKKPSDPLDEVDDYDELRAKIIGLGEHSARKSYYPELRARLAELERFRVALDGSHDAIFLVELPVGRLLDVNETACRMLRLSRDELIGRPLGELVPALAARVERPDERPDELAGGHEPALETTLRTSAGSEIPVEVTLHFARVGAERYAVAAARDITERLRTQQTVKVLAEAGSTLSRSLDLASTLESLGQVTLPFLGDVCAIYRRAYSGAIERLAVKFADDRGIAVARALEERPENAAYAERAVARALERGRPELLTEETDDAHRPMLRELGLSSMLVMPYCAGVRTSGVLLFGRVAGSGRRHDRVDLEVAQQLAQRAAMALENARLYTEAQDASRLKVDFLAIVSHELRTPLTAILGWANILVSGRRGEDVISRAAAAIERNAHALGALIDDLLDVSRLLANKLDVVRSPMALAPIVEAAVASSRPAFEAKKLSLEVSIAQDLPPILGHAQRLSQVVTNLLTNAINFTPAGGRVEVALRRRNERAELAVRDTGRGITPDFLPHVFEAFRQTQGVTDRGRAGLGLGLSIVRHIVELHDGEVRAASPGEGLGACFTVYLPFAGRDDLAETPAEGSCGVKYTECLPKPVSGGTAPR